MKYELIGNVMPAVEITFDQAGESMFTQSGGLAWMTGNIGMETNAKGGFGKSIGRLFAGESLFMATYSAQAAGEQIAFSCTAPGEIMAVDVGQTGGLICQKGAFLCAEPSVELNVTFTKKISSGLFGGEGVILQELTGSGMAFLEIDGNKVEKVLQPGEVLKVDTGCVVAFDKGMPYEIEMVKGAKNIFFGGEGLFLTKLTGPGKVVVQTQNFGEFVGRIARLLPNKD